MKILVLSAGGNPGTNTDQVADAFIKGAAESGHNVSKVNLGKLEMPGLRSLSEKRESLRRAG